MRRGARRFDQKLPNEIEENEMRGGAWDIFSDRLLENAITGTSFSFAGIAKDKGVRLGVGPTWRGNKGKEIKEPELKHETLHPRRRKSATGSNQASFLMY